MARRIHSGRKIAAWRLQAPDDGIVHVIEVRMLDETRASKTQFRACLAALDIDEQDHDIDVLRVRMQKLINERSNVVWSPYLHVEVLGDRSGTDDDGEVQKGDLFEVYKHRNPRMQIKISIEQIELTTIDDEKRHRYSEHSGRHDPRDGWPSVGRFGELDPEEPKDIAHTLTATSALIPDTPENRAALERIREGFAAIVERLDALLAPTLIEDTFALLATGRVALRLAEDVGPKATIVGTINQAAPRKRTRH